MSYITRSVESETVEVNKSKRAIVHIVGSEASIGTLP